MLEKQIKFSFGKKLLVGVSLIFAFSAEVFAEEEWTRSPADPGIYVGNVYTGHPKDAQWAGIRRAPNLLPQVCIKVFSKRRNENQRMRFVVIGFDPNARRSEAYKLIHEGYGSFNNPRNRYWDEETQTCAIENACARAFHKHGVRIVKWANHVDPDMQGDLLMNIHRDSLSGISLLTKGRCPVSLD